MAKSKVIKELANGTIDTLTALKRAKVLLYDLDNQEISDWINCEITGYPKDAELPSYRVIRGTLMGSYFKGSLASHATWTNVSLPLGKMPSDAQDKLLNVGFYEGIDALKQLLQTSKDNGHHLGASLGADLFPYIAHYNDDPYMMITSARVSISEHCIQNIFSIVENRLLEILMTLESEFGNLDDLDIDTSTKTPEELEKIINNISVIIYNDQRVSIGDKNTIKGSTIASEITK